MGAWTGLNRGQIREQTRAEINEPEPGYFKDDTLNLWINRAQLDFCRRTKILTTSGTKSSQATVKTYNLSEDFLRMEYVFYQGLPLDYVPETDFLDLIGDGGSIDEPGTPTLYYLRGTASSTWCLWLWPVPNQAVEEGIEMWYEQGPDELAEDSHKSIIHPMFHEALVLFTLSRAHRKLRQLSESRESLGEYMDIVKDAHGARQRPVRGITKARDTETVGTKLVV